MCTEDLTNRVHQGEWTGLVILTSFGSLMYLLGEKETPFSRRTVRTWMVKKSYLGFVFYFYLFMYFIFMATPMAYENAWARGRIGVIPATCTTATATATLDL